MYFVSVGANLELTPQARLLVDALLDACRALGYGRKQTAAFQILTEAQWKRQADGGGGQHVSLYRVALMPAQVIRAWIKRIAPAYGLRVFDRTDDICRLIDAVDAQIGSQRRQLRMTLSDEQDRRSA